MDTAFAALKQQGFKEGGEDRYGTLWQIVTVFF